MKIFIVIFEYYEINKILNYFKMTDSTNFMQSELEI